jgi:hypothetical protein
VLKLRKSTLFWTGKRAQSEAYFRQITYLAGFLSTLIIPKRGEELNYQKHYKRNMERSFDPSVAQLEGVTVDAAKTALESA